MKSNPPVVFYDVLCVGRSNTGTSYLDSEGSTFGAWTMQPNAQWSQGHWNLGSPNSLPCSNEGVNSRDGTEIRPTLPSYSSCLGSDSLCSASFVHHLKVTWLNIFTHLNGERWLTSSSGTALKVAPLITSEAAPMTPEEAGFHCWISTQLHLGHLWHLWT